MKFEKDPSSTFPEIAVTNFHSQNLEFGTVQKRYSAQLGTKGNLHTKLEKDQSSTFSEIAVTNFHLQNPRWPPVGYLEFGSSQKRYNAQLGTKGNLPMEFKKDSSSTFPEIAVTRIVYGRTDGRRTTDAGRFE